MNIRNQDLDLDKFFVNTKSRQIANIREIKNQPLNKNIYYSPSSSPLVSVHNVESGSCYQDWIIPTASVFIDTQNKLLPQYLQLDHYQHLLINKIQKTVKKIYTNHSRVYLAYSGGIDSMVILSAVLSLGLAAKTTLVIFENHSQSADDCLHLDLDRKNLVNDVCNHVKNLGCSVEYEYITKDDIVAAMQKGLVETKCYVTYTLMSRHSDRAWMFGHHGNQILLHKDVFLDEILYQSPEKQPQVESAVSQNYFYTKNLKDYQVTKSLVPLHQRHLMLKPWALLDGHNNCRIYAPIAPDNETFNWCRSVDYKTIDPGVITNATLARHLISQFQQDWLDHYITTESVNDMDVLGPVLLPVDKLDLGIPENLCHNPEGIDWLKYEIANAKTHGHIAINTVVSLKNLNWLANL